MTHLLLAVIYLSFISLGLPDSLLGSAWPSMYGDLAVPLSYAGILSTTIAVGTVISSLLSHRLTRAFGTGKVTAASVALTAAALFGFSVSASFPVLCLWAIPYGLGAGSVDASLNHYVALHYASRHMSWLHCMWGMGAALGPYIMGFALTGGRGWSAGYRTISVLQMGLTAVLLLSLPLWRKANGEGAHPDQAAQPSTALSLGQIVQIPGAREVMLCFFCYCALEQTIGLWASSYLTLCCGLPPDRAASFASLYFIGITIGRMLSGFLTLKFSDSQMVYGGQGILAVAVAVLLLPLGEASAIIFLLLAGLGCAPVYPCLIHSTPHHFGAERSQAIIGVQMASAYVGICVMPPIFGWIANRIHVGLFPLYLAAILALMVQSHHMLLRKSAAAGP